MLTPAQLRAARALLGWSREQLAEVSGTHSETVKGFELRGSDPKLSTLNAWRRALEQGGVVFVEPDPMGGDTLGPGVRLRHVDQPDLSLPRPRALDRLQPDTSMQRLKEPFAEKLKPHPNHVEERQKRQQFAASRRPEKPKG